MSANNWLLAHAYVRITDYWDTPLFSKPETLSKTKKKYPKNPTQIISNIPTFYRFIRRFIKLFSKILNIFFEIFRTFFDFLSNLPKLSSKFFQKISDFFSKFYNRTCVYYPVNAHPLCVYPVNGPVRLCGVTGYSLKIELWRFAL